MNEKLLIHGCGGHARSVAAAMKVAWDIIFVDANARSGERILGFPVVSRMEDVAGYEQMAHHVAIGNLEKKKAVFLALKEKGLLLPPLVAGSAEIMDDTVLEAGVFVGAGAYIGPKAKISENAIINTHAVVEHDAVIGPHSHISIHATVAGYSQIGESVMLAAGATVIDKLQIKDHIVIGAGGVVVRSINSSGTYIGVPARKLFKYEGRNDGEN